MDWEQTQPSAGLGPSGAAGIGNGEDPADMDTNMVVGTSSPGRRVLGRKISHRKNPSDTFAFAAGQLFQHTPEDFYNLLDAPLEYSSGAQTLQHAISANEVLVSPQTSFGGSLQHGSHAALHAAARQVSLGDLQASDGNLAGTLSGSSLAGAAATAATATSQLTAPAPLANPPAARPADQQPATAADAAEAAQEDGQQMPEDQPEDEEQDDDEEQHLQQRPRARSTRRQQQAAAQTRANALDPTMLDPRRAKRILANRQSAQRSRMKRLQYIHDLENRSAATSATVKELQAEVERLQEQQAGLAESVEARKVQVNSLTHQLLQEQSLQASLCSHISALRSQLQWQQQQQQEQQQHRQQPAPWPHPSAQQRPQQQPLVKPEPRHHMQEGRLPQQYIDSVHQPGRHLQQRPSLESLQPNQQQIYLQQYHPTAVPPSVDQIRPEDHKQHSAAVPMLEQRQQHLPLQQQPQRQKQYVLQGIPVHDVQQQRRPPQQQQRLQRGSSGSLGADGGPSPSAGNAARAVSPAAAAAAAAMPQQHSYPPPAAAPPAGPHGGCNGSAGSLSLHRTPSPCKSLSVDLQSPLNLSLPSSLPASLGANMSDMNDPQDLDGLMFQDHKFDPLYLGANLTSANSGSLGLHSMGSGSLAQTPSIDLAAVERDLGLGSSQGAPKASGLGPSGSGSRGYAVQPEDVMGAGVAYGGAGGHAPAAAGSVEFRKTLSM